MPRGDRTGPRGMGSMTGRGAGYCAGYDAPGFTNAGWGCGRGFGRRCRPVQAPAAPVNQRQLLKDQAAWLEQQLGQVKGRLADMNDGE